MSKKIIIDNFHSMNPDKPDFSKQSSNFFMSGVYPKQYLDMQYNSTNGHEKQEYPLWGSPIEKGTSLPGGYSGIADICPSPWATDFASGQTVVLCTLLYQTGQIFNFIGNSSLAVGSLGAGVTVTNTGRITPFNARLVATSDANSNVYNITNNGTVSSTGGLTYTGCHPLFYFKDFCAVADGSLIRKLTTGFVLSSGIDLGGDWKATLKMTNIGNDYLVIPASRGYGNDFVFLWNGISSTYQYALEVPGKVLGVQTVKGRLYIAVRNTANRCVIYLQKGKQLEIVTHPLLNFNGSIAKDGLSLFHGSSLLVSTTAGSFIYGDSFVGVYSTNQYERYCIGNDSYTYGSVTATQAVYKFDDQVTTHNPIVYISKWIPLSGKLSAINIYYDTPPTSASDTISVSLDSWGENQYTGVTNIPLTTITNTNYTTTKRTILDVKDFTGDLCRINLQTTSNVPSTWQPIIRKIELIVQ